MKRKPVWPSLFGVTLPRERNILMRGTPASVRSVRFGPFEADLRAGELIKQGRRIRLQDQPLHILVMLLERPGEMIGREELQQRLWPATSSGDFDHGLNNAINRLREALGDSAENPRYIATIPRRGYRFVAAVETNASGSAEESLIGLRLGHYLLIEKLAVGAEMGEVYRSRDQRLDRQVTLKVLPAESQRDETARKRLRAELLTLAKLNHANIETFFGLETHESADVLVMEYVPGITLAERLAAGALPEEEVARLGLQIASALDEAHEHGIVHGDLKPASIVVTPKGQVKVLAFGLAKLLRPATNSESRAQIVADPALAVGTLPHMPQQLKGEAADARADIYALGAVLYEMATGQRLVREESASPLTGVTRHHPCILPRTLNPRVSPELERTLLKCLETDSADAYQSAKEVAAALRPLARPAPFTTAHIPAPARRAWRRAALPVGSAVAGVLAVAVLLTLVNVGGWRDRVLTRATHRPIRSVAVLPLKSLTGDPEYFVDAITDALTTELAQVSALHVISRTSAMRYKTGNRPLPEIARQLKVDAVVGGTVRRTGSQVRITAELIEAAADRHLWGSSYERDLGALPTLQSEIVRDLVRSMKVDLTPQETARFSRTQSVNLEALDYYLRAQSHVGLMKRDDNDAAIRLLERAVALDPNFAAAHVALSSAYQRRAFSIEPKIEWEEKAFASVQKALRMDPNLAEAYVARGLLLWSHRQHFSHERAVQEFRRALHLNPNLAEAHHQLAHVYNHIGLLDKAAEEIQKAVGLDPFNTGAQFRVGVNLLYQGRYEESLTAIRDAQRFFPALWGFQTSFALFQLGRQLEAKERVAEFMRKDPEDRGGLLAGLQALFAAAAGNPSKAEEWIQTALTKEKGYQHFHHTAYIIGSAYARMNEPGLAVRYLEQAAEDGFPCYTLFEKDTNLDSIRGSPRFTNFMAEQKKQWEYFKAKL